MLNTEDNTLSKELRAKRVGNQTIKIRVLRRDFDKALKMNNKTSKGLQFPILESVCPIAQAVRRVTKTHKSVWVGDFCLIGDASYNMTGNHRKIMAHFDYANKYCHGYVTLTKMN